MRITIYQPQYFPRLHYFHRILNADCFVILCSAQFTRTLNHITPEGKKRHPSFQAVTPVKGDNDTRWLTVSVKHTGLLPINDTRVDYSASWNKKHTNILQQYYRKAAQFNLLFPELRRLLQATYKTLADMNIQTILWGVSKILKLGIPLEKLSIREVNSQLSSVKNVRLKRITTDLEVGVDRPDGSSQGSLWTAKICEKLGATEYLHGGTGADSYMDEKEYTKRGIKLVQQDWKCPEYKQLSNNFQSNLSIMDLLFNENETNTQKVLGII